MRMDFLLPHGNRAHEGDCPRLISATVTVWNIKFNPCSQHHARSGVSHGRPFLAAGFDDLTHSSKVAWTNDGLFQ
jgi:hypothetical protein